MSLGAALGWKYNHVEGIETVNNKLTAWPESLGDAPTDAEMAAIVAEYNSEMIKTGNLLATENISNIARKVEDILDLLQNDTPLPINPDTGKAYAIEWLDERKGFR